MNTFTSSICLITENVYRRIYGKSYKVDCTIPRDELRYVCVSHYGFDGQIHCGELIIHRKIAEKVVGIFQELFDAKYPIEKILLVDEYNADDIYSMSDNNSSAFNYRTIEGTTILSNHSSGLAIDINPLYNPYVRFFDGQPSVLPENGTQYADRTLDCPYYIHKGDICYCTFIKYGFTWGGEWEHAKDYQHFEIAIGQ